MIALSLGACVGMYGSTCILYHHQCLSKLSVIHVTHKMKDLRESSNLLTITKTHQTNYTRQISHHISILSQLDIICSQNFSSLALLQQSVTANSHPSYIINALISRCKTKLDEALGERRPPWPW